MSTFKTVPGMPFPLSLKGSAGMLPGTGLLPGSGPFTPAQNVPGPCMMGGPARTRYEVQRTSQLAAQVSKPTAAGMALYRVPSSALGVASVREKIEESGQRYDEDQIQKMEQRFAELHNRLLGMAVAIGRDTDMTLEFEPKEPTAAMKLEKPRVFRIGAELLLNESAERLISISMHEGAHADISGVGSGAFFKNELLLALFNVLEDIRVNARVEDRAPGRAEGFRKDFHEIYRDAYQELERMGLVESLLPHEAFLEGIISREYGTTSRWHQHPIIGPAVEQVWQAVQEIKALRPGVDVPSEGVRENLILSVEGVIRRKVLPIYKRLIQMSADVLRQKLEQDACQCGGSQQANEGGKASKGQAGSAGGAGNSSADNTEESSTDGEQGAAGGRISEEDCPSCGGHLMSPEEMEKAVEQMINERAEELSKIHAPKGTLGDLQERAKRLMGEGGSLATGEGDAPKASQAGRQQSSEPFRAGNARMNTADPQTFATGQISSQSPASFQPTNLAHAMQLLMQDASAHKESLMRNPYSEFLSELRGLPNQVFQVFDQLLKPTGDFEFDGYFTSGPRIDIERAVRAVHGMLANLGVFERKVEPSSKTWRFLLLIDASGSMTDSVRERGGLGMAALFTDVFERIELPYGMDLFHDVYIPLKGFEQRLRTVEERNAFFKKMILSHWGRGGTDIRAGIQGALQRIREERKREPRDQEFLFVLTDGEDTYGGGKSIRELSEEAAKEGIIIVGIGIGEGMQTVQQQFPVHLTETNPLNLPKLLMEFIKEYAKVSTEEDW